MIPLINFHFRLQCRFCFTENYRKKKDEDERKSFCLFFAEFRRRKRDSYYRMLPSQWAKSPKKQSVYFECRINKNALLQTVLTTYKQRRFNILCWHGFTSDIWFWTTFTSSDCPLIPVHVYRL